jgi:hypothetical protein
MTSARVEPPTVGETPRARGGHDAHDGGRVADVEQDEAHAAGEDAVAHAHGGPPPPVVPQIRKGAKASLRRKGAR